MRCTYCGSKLPDGSVFCSVCGAKMAEPVETPRVPRDDPWEGLFDEQKTVAPAQPVYEQPAATEPVYEQPASAQPQMDPAFGGFTPDGIRFEARPVPGTDPAYTAYPAGTAPGAAPAYAAYPAAGAPAKKKKSKAGLVLGIVAVLLLLLGTASALVGFNAFGMRDKIFGKEDTLAPAIEAMGEELDEVLSRGELGRLLQASKQMDPERFSAAYTLDFGMMLSNIHMDTQIEWDGTQKIGNMTAKIVTDGTDAMDGTIRYSFQGDEMRFSVDGVDGVYGGTRAELEPLMGGVGQMFDMLDELRGMPALEMSYDALRNGELKEIFDSFSSEADGAVTITTDGGDKTADAYRLHWDHQKVTDYLNAHQSADSAAESSMGIDQMLSLTQEATDGIAEMLDGLDSIEAYAADGHVVGFDLCKPDGTATYVRLKGEANVFDHISINSSGSDVVTEMRVSTEGTVDIVGAKGGESTGGFRYDGTNGAFTLVNGDSESGPTQMTGWLCSDGSDGIRISFNAKSSSDGYEMKMDYDIRLRALNGTPAQLSDDFIRLSDLSEEEMAALEQKLMNALLVNPIETDPTDPYAYLEGDYVFVGYEMGSEFYDREPDDSNITIRLDHDGRGAWLEDGYEAPFSWSCNGTYIYLTYDDTRFGEETYELHGSDELYWDQSGYYMVFRR